ncbi:MAG: FAD-dependent oxidoreductase [Solirubrobacterales bacterium]
MDAAPRDPPLRAIVYGGDLAALETALALSRLSERCRVTLLTPVRDLPVRIHAAGAPPAEGRPARFDLGALASEHGLEFRSDAIVGVDHEHREVRTITGARIAYDALVVAFGARPRGAFPGVTTCWGTGDAGTLDGIVDELRSGAARDVVFAVPRAVRWTLPTYELALSTARRAAREGLSGYRLRLVTHEDHAVELLGPAAGAAVRARLDGAGIELLNEREPLAFEQGRLSLLPDSVIEADRVLSMPVIEGPRIAGLPRDVDGFLPVDLYGRVEGVDGIWAAGEVTAFPVRQAGIAAQQARAVAASIAAEAGSEIAPEPFRPVVRGMLRSSAGSEAGASNGNGGSALLWWPPEQLAGEHLSAHIGGKMTLRPPSGADSISVAVELGPDGRRLAGSKS